MCSMKLFYLVPACVHSLGSGNNETETSIVLVIDWENKENLDPTLFPPVAEPSN